MTEIVLPKLSICIDAYPEDQMFDEKEIPLLIDLCSTNREELALAKYKMWESGQLLRIAFLDGEKVLWKMVEREARRWLEHANLEFEFGNFPDAEIRVTFQGYGYWSLVGTDALKQPFPLPTMTLGGFTNNADPIELRRVVIHEFGHALGCVHEQASPSIAIPWDKERVYAYYSNYVGWDKARVDHNVFKRYSRSEVNYTEQHDPESIMQYPVPNELTLGDFEIGWNTELSERDKEFIARMYPKES